jgi:hypothetical protein
MHLLRAAPGIVEDGSSGDSASKADHTPQPEPNPAIWSRSNKKTVVAILVLYTAGQLFQMLVKMHPDSNSSVVQLIALLPFLSASWNTSVGTFYLAAAIMDYDNFARLKHFFQSFAAWEYQHLLDPVSLACTEE